MSLYNQLNNRLLLPFSDQITGLSISKYVKFLSQSQSWTRDQLDSWQLEHLKKLVAHAYTSSAFYKKKFDHAGLHPRDIVSLDDITKMPITTKKELKENFIDVISTGYNRKRAIYNSSSGSTGEPFQFLLSKETESMHKASTIRGWGWHGYRLGDKYVKLSMLPRESMIKKLQDRVNRSLLVSTTQLTKQIFQKAAKDIIAYNPRVIRGYPVPLELLSEVIKDKYGEYPDDNLIALNTTGSTLHSSVKQKIEHTFKRKIFDSYSCEGGSLFFQCPLCNQYHPTEEHAVSEFIADEFTEKLPEKPLRHITTDLLNYAFPFIRYDTQDYIVLSDENVIDCGLPYEKVQRIMGRDSDSVITPSGKILIVENFVAYFEWIPEVDEVQVYQSDKDRVQIRLVVNDSFSTKLHNDILEYWQKYIGDDVKVDIAIVSELPTTAIGKRRTVLRNPDIEINA